MSILTHQPNRPYRNLLLAALIGVPAGSLLYSLILAAFQASSLSQAATLVADALFASYIGYIAMAVLLLLYGLPVMWLSLHFRLAGPLVALLVALLPGICLLLFGSIYETLIWLPLMISAATGISFVMLAYRGTPPNNSFKPKPLRGSA